MQSNQAPLSPSDILTPQQLADRLQVFHFIGAAPAVGQITHGPESQTLGLKLTVELLNAGFQRGPFDLETEVEMKLPGRFKVSPQIAGAIKAVSGVVDVQTL